MKKNKIIEEILKDLVRKIKDEQPIKPKDKDDYLYDRPKFMTRYSSPYDKYHYWMDIETLRVMIYQLHFFNHIVFTDDDNKDIRNNKLIQEKSL